MEFSTIMDSTIMEFDCTFIFCSFIPTENMRFRESELSFKVSETATEEEVRRVTKASYPDMAKTMGTFHLEVESGDFSNSEILVMLGENGTGKTTFIR